MKKEIKNLLAQESASMRLSDICYLTRWQKDALGDAVDKLAVRFDSPTGARCFYAAEIGSRDVEGITREIAQQTEEFAKRWAEEEVKKVLAGRMEYKFYDTALD